MEDQLYHLQRAQLNYYASLTTTQEYRGEVQTSALGVHPVIIYDIPGSTRCYVFHRHKRTLRGELYRCYGRKQNGKYTSVMIIDNVFQENPCRLTHTCLPLNRIKDKANRFAYESCQKVKRDPKVLRTTPNRLYNDIAFDILKSTWKTPQARKKVLAEFVRKGYGCRRLSFARALSSRIRRVEMDSVPEDLKKLPDGTNFLQIQLPDMHIYYADEVIRSATEVGLHAIIGDGVHKLNPITIQSGMEKGQLYTLHAACGGGFEVPILIAVTRQKTRAVYNKIFDCLRQRLGNGNFRIILDYEKAAIKSAKEVFPQAQFQGCAFHLAQSWNRMAKHLGVRQFIRGAKKVRSVIRWWNTIKGVVFLPKNLIERVPALNFPPVNRRHVSYLPRKKFLDYLKETWFNGKYRDMWCKFDIDELRTTNAAEAFHKKLRGLLGRKTHPPFEELIECLQRISIVALGTLLYIEENPRTTKPLRRRDVRRRQKISAAMESFKEEYRSGNCITTATINSYCIAMSKFVTEKTIWFACFRCFV